ncbi:hypothetical protein BZA77DRAFT_360226 [Pyronema omphalodes]|nr:hypothetical protein BZA77DRAFT_360226 [Pyronema omphalodes]
MRLISISFSVLAVATGILADILDFSDFTLKCGTTLPIPVPYHGFIITNAAVINTTGDINCHAHSGGGGPWGKSSSPPNSLTSNSNSVTFATYDTTKTFSLSSFNVSSDLPSDVYRRPNTLANATWVFNLDGVARKESWVVPPKARSQRFTVPVNAEHVKSATIGLEWDYIDENGAPHNVPAYELYVDDVVYEFSGSYSK